MLERLAVLWLAILGVVGLALMLMHDCGVGMFASPPVPAQQEVSRG